METEPPFLRVLAPCKRIQDCLDSGFHAVDFGFKVKVTVRGRVLFYVGSLKQSPGSVPEKPISANIGLKFCSGFVFYLPV